MSSEMCEFGPSSTGLEMKSSLKILTSLAKRPEVDIEFQDLTYTVRGDKKNERKEILHGVSGAFQTGKLTAILGPSGAGKSTLMNILVGYSTLGVKGSILVNGKPRDKKLYHKLSCYIMQEDLMHDGLTVDEAMNVAAELKLGGELKSQDKLLVIEEVLSVLGLETCRNVRTEHLSGGQKKRLAVALELVNNPPIIFLDEPTSGLDIVSMTHCINLLKHLASCGRTIVCTIHQPSASVLSIFDNIYVLARGKCVYQGSPQHLVPFMNNLGFNCPLTHNPADFIMETLQIDTNHVDTLSIAVENGNIFEDGNSDDTRIGRNIKIRKKYNDITLGFNTNATFSSSFCTQFTVLLKRMFLQKRRNTTSLGILILHHVLTGILYGGIYYNVGNNGTSASANFKFCMSILVFFLYSYVMIPVLLFPTEFKILRREYFNRWYGLKAYYAALSVASAPLMIFLGIMFLALTYYMSGQLMELERFFLYSLMCILTGYCSEGLGLLIGSLFNAQNGSIIACGVASPLMGLCFYGLGFGPYIETFMKILMRLSYLRYAIVGACLAIYKGRPTFDCDGVLYCHYGDPRILLRDLGMKDAEYAAEVSGLLFFTILFRIVTYFILRIRLQREFSNKYISYLSRYLRN